MLPARILTGKGELTTPMLQRTSTQTNGLLSHWNTFIQCSSQSFPAALHLNQGRTEQNRTGRRTHRTEQYRSEAETARVDAHYLQNINSGPQTVTPPLPLPPRGSLPDPGAHSEISLHTTLALHCTGECNGHDVGVSCVCSRQSRNVQGPIGRPAWVSVLATGCAESARPHARSHRAVRARAPRPRGQV